MGCEGERRNKNHRILTTELLVVPLTDNSNKEKQGEVVGGSSQVQRIVGKAGQSLGWRQNNLWVSLQQGLLRGNLEIRLNYSLQILTIKTVTDASCNGVTSWLQPPDLYPNRLLESSVLSEMACPQVVEVPLGKGKFLDVEIVKGEKLTDFILVFMSCPY